MTEPMCVTCQVNGVQAAKGNGYGGRGMTWTRKHGRSFSRCLPGKYGWESRATVPPFSGAKVGVWVPFASLLPISIHTHTHNLQLAVSNSSTNYLSPYSSVSVGEFPTL